MVDVFVLYGWAQYIYRLACALGRTSARLSAQWVQDPAYNNIVHHCGTLWNFVELCGAVWNFVELCGALWGSVACTDARRTETVNKAARLDHTAPNQCSITDFIESNMINDVYTLLSICSLRLQTLTPLLGRIFSSDIELALLNQASWKLFS